MKLNIVSSRDGVSLNKHLYSFLNPYSLAELLKCGVVNESIKFCVDGGALAKFFSYYFGHNFERMSFDFTSIANDVFEECEKNSLSISFVGATKDEMNLFVDKIKRKYPELNILYSINGYYRDEDEVMKRIYKSDVLVVSMGAVKQENFLLAARSSGFEGTGFTCGGFVRQYSSTENEMYYPKLINKLKIRFLYRVYKEPHTLRRYIKYPLNMLSIYVALKKGKLVVNKL
ncbi:WecB/TagA/CpsF family glycosyltransferase [Neptunomonas phycophila]|uniref:WecB/TagA/CpsF family glycosyltransferase n=1 Tax=Neptunomonas phycophila TaxID=1572645 RepID=UPI0037369871